MVVSDNRYAHPLSKRFLESARAAGFDSSAGYKGTAYEGAWPCEIAHKDGRRFSAYDAYLEPAMKRSNLEVLTDALVTPIVLENGRAIGVAVRRGEHEVVHCAGGVVLAAGAFGSPQILMLSGIGPGSHLQEFGIPVVRDTPEVGENLQDHPLTCVVFRTRGNDSFKKAGSPLALIRYLLFKTGPPASNAIEAFAFARIHAATAPDLELIFVPFEWRKEGLEPPSIHAFGIAPAVVAPWSRGRVRLRTPSADDPPAIDLGLLNDPDGIDASVLVAGARLARRIASLPPLSEENAGEITPGAGIEDNDALRRALHGELQTVYHPTSTCRMGVDPGAVVTPALRMRGVGGLWIADASVMPSVPRGHPNAVVAMIANRAATWIVDSLS